jgi:hypothetical protein
VTVAFTAPASNGGSAITQYTATSSPGAFTGTVSQAGDGKVTVTGLTAATTYTFTVMATNAKGPSLASGPSASVVTATATATATAPGTPRVTVVAGDKKATATMTAGTGVTPTSYTATAYAGGGVAYGTGAPAAVAAGTGCTATVAPWSCDVTGLTNGTQYTVRVTATKAGVTSPVPAVSGTVIPYKFMQTYALGGRGPAGGYVFYVSTDAFTSKGSACGTSCHYLEVSGTEHPYGFLWCSNEDATGTFGTAIGSGYENTRQMLAQCDNNKGAAYAASGSNVVNGVKFSDWFLPSKDELNELYKAQATSTSSSFPFSTTTPYWSSSTPGMKNAYAQEFVGGAGRIHFRNSE